MNREIQFRTATISRRDVDAGNRVIKNVSVSSDEPYKRWFGTEILSHEPGAVDLSRIEKGAVALLFNHDRDALIGKVSNPQLRNGRLYVDLRFSQSEAGQQALADAKDGILTECSIGYSVAKFEVDEDEETYTATKWELFECSLVTIPADHTVGVGRSEIQLLHRSTMEKQTEERPGRTMTETQSERHTRKIRELATFFANSKSPTWKALPFDVEAEAERCIAQHMTENEFQQHVVKAAFGNAKPLQTPDGEFPLSGFDRRGGLNGDGNKTIGELILSHRNFQQVRQGGQKSISFDFPHLSRLHLRASLGTADFGGAVQTAPGPVFANERLVVSDLLAQGTTTSATVRYPRENAFVPAATTVAEAGLKPAQSFDTQPIDASVRKVAAWVQCSDELLDDNQAAAAYINSRLGFAVQKQEDNQLLNGDGLGTNVLGILATPGIQTQARGADTSIDAIRKAIGKIDTNTDFIASGVVLNPANWQAIELLKDGNGNYLCGHVFVMSEMGVLLRAPSIWGLPVALSKSITAGTALVGAFRVAAQIFRRQGLTIQISNSDSTDFQFNLQKIRAELRLALAVYAPPAFVQVTGLS